MNYKNKVPTKIYINTINVGDNHYSIDGTDNPVDKKYEVEFINKNALLKWANDNLLECEASDDDADYGRIDAYKKLIDKLNSL